MSSRPTIPFGIKLLFLFVAMPLLEIFTIITLYQLTGLAVTVAVIVLSAVVGVSLMKMQWRQVFGRASRAGAAPGELLGEAVLLLMAGALLISPGIFTDIIGYSLLVPPIRRAIVRRGMQHFAGKAAQSFSAGGRTMGGFSFQFGGMRPPPGASPEQREDLESTPEDAPPSGSPFDERSPFDRLKK